MVEIIESKFGNRKFHKCRKLMVFGVIERETKRLVQLQSELGETLLEIIKKNILL